MLALTAFAPAEAWAGKCKKLRPARGKVCGIRCSSQGGTVEIQFKDGDPYAQFYVLLGDCVKFSVQLDEFGRATFVLDHLTEIHPGYFKALVPAEPVPEEVVIKFKSCR